MNHLRRAGLALFLLAAAAGCRGSGSETDTQTAERAAAEAAARDVSPDFAAELGVDLESMTRSTSGLYTQDLVDGIGLSARPGHLIVIRYSGWIPNGELFDSTEDDPEPYTFPLGAGRAIEGWEEGIAGMRIGGKRRLVIPPQLGYGSRGVPGDVPPNATLVYEIELIDIRM
ncbi:MAG: FKBP-type peptidyl-prolyl cis-trans isomerase [Gemmatimonadota bacterium]